MTTLTWPRCVLVPTSVQADPMARSKSGGVSVTGIEQVVSSGAGAWGVKYSQVIVNTPKRRKTFRAVAALLEGRAGAIAVPIYDANSPSPGPYPSLPHGDGARFSDGAGYAQLAMAAQLSAATLRATSIVFSITTTQIPEAGQHFTITHPTVGERLYRIKTIFLQLGAYAATIWPPLREAVVTGTVMDFDNPRCLMRLASDDAMDLDLSGARLGRPSVAFVEALASVANSAPGGGGVSGPVPPGLGYTLSLYYTQNLTLFASLF